MTAHTIRVERPGNITFDLNVSARSLADARDHFQRANPDYAPFDWRGAVVFCNGKRAAEETYGAGVRR